MSTHNICFCGEIRINIDTFKVSKFEKSAFYGAIGYADSKDPDHLCICMV